MAAQNINRVVITGNLTADPEVRQPQSGRSLCRLRLASNSPWKGESGDWEDKANYFDIVVWGVQGENAARYLSKGSGIGIDGRLEWREWEDRDGRKRQSVEIIAENIQFLPKGGSTGSAGAGPELERRPDNADEDNIPF